MKVVLSTQLQTPSHLKRCFSHIQYPNLACYSSLESQRQGASTYQISSSVAKTTRSYIAKPEKVFCKVSLNSTFKSIIIRLLSLQTLTRSSLYSPSSLLNNLVEPNTLHLQLKLFSQGKKEETSHDPSPPFKERVKVLGSVANGRFLAWWPMEG